MLNDLKSLNKTKLKLTKETKADWLIVDSGNDRIIPGSRGQELLPFLGADKYQKMEDGVHAFPAANPSECIRIISDAFPIFETK